MKFTYLCFVLLLLPIHTLHAAPETGATTVPKTNTAPEPGATTVPKTSTAPEPGATIVPKNGPAPGTGIAAPGTDATAAASSRLTLQNVVRIGLKRSPRLKKSAADLAAAEYQTRQVKGALFPRVDLKTIATQSDFNGADSQADNELYRAYAEFTQPLYSGGALSGAFALRTQTEAIQRLRLLQDTQSLVRDIVSTYYNVSEQMRYLQAAGENVEALESHAKVINRYEKIGRARRSDKLQAQVNLVTAQAEIYDLKAQLFAQQENLRQLLALDSLPEIIFDGTHSSPAKETMEPNSAINQAFQANPEIQIAELEVAQVQNEKKISLAEDLPSLSLSGQLGYRNTDRGSWFDSSSEYSAVTLDLTIPIFSGLSSVAKRRNFEQQSLSATRDLEIRKFNLEAMLRSLFREISSIENRLKMSREAANDARLALELANRDYQRSTISSQDVVSIQRTRYDAERLRIRTQYNYERALLRLREALGRDLAKLYAN